MRGCAAAVVAATALGAETAAGATAGRRRQVVPLVSFIQHQAGPAPVGAGWLALAWRGTGSTAGAAAAAVRPCCVSPGVAFRKQQEARAATAAPWSVWSGGTGARAAAAAAGLLVLAPPVIFRQHLAGAATRAIPWGVGVRAAHGVTGCVTSR